MTKKIALLSSASLAMMLFSSLLSAQEFRLELEEPVNGATATGVSNIRGWAIASEGIDRIEIAIDGQYAFDIPYGGLRVDVGNAFPGVTNSDLSGFGLTFNFGDLGAGDHTLTATAIGSDGSELEQSSQFRVLAFPTAFLAESETPSLADATVELDADDGTIELKGITQGGEEFEIELEWSTASQSFQIVDLDQQLLLAACSGELPLSDIPDGITFSKGFTRNVSVDDEVISGGSEFTFSLVNGSSLPITVEELVIEDDEGTLAITPGTSIASLDGGVLGARRVLDATFAVPSSGAEEEIDVEFVLSIDSQCFDRDYELYDASDEPLPEGYSTTSSGLQFAVIEDGEGPRPSPADTVRIDYVGALEDGTVFDSSYSRGEPNDFGVSALIDGFTEALLLMNEGATFTVRIPPELAYGSRAVGTIPANSTLLFEITLLELL